MCVARICMNCTGFSATGSPLRSTFYFELQDLQRIINKMPLPVICMSVLPEFGLRWREVSRAVRNCYLPMMPASVARVIRLHAGNSLAEDEIGDIVARLRLKLVVATQDRKWFVINLTEPCETVISVAHLLRSLPRRLEQALKKTRAGRTSHPEIQTAMNDGLVYISLQLNTDRKEGPVLYVCSPPGAPVALVSSLGGNKLQPVVEALGYKTYEDAKLFGRDIISLLRIHDRANNENVNHLVEIPEYNPIPIVTKSANTVTIDYTNSNYNEQYVDNLLGPDPPLLTDLTVTSTDNFFDPSRLQKKININVQLKSDDVAKTLKVWVSKGAIPPTSLFFNIFHKIKSNKVSIDGNVDDYN